MWYNPDHRSGDTHWKPKTKRLNKQRLNSTALHYNLALDINKKEALVLDKLNEYSEFHNITPEDKQNLVDKLMKGSS